MIITGTDIKTPLEVGFLYGVTITGLTASHVTELQYEDEGGFQTIADTEGIGSADQDHVILVTSKRIQILVSAGTGDLNVNFTRIKNR